MFGEFRIESKQEVIQFIRNELAAGNTLAKFLSRLSLEDGIVTTFLPVDTPSEQVQHYAAGIISRGGSTGILAAVIKDYLARPGRYAVFEDICFDLDTPSTVDWDEQYFSYNLEVYYFLAHANWDVEEIIDVIRTPCPNPFIGLLVSFPVGKSISIANRERVDKRLLAHLADHTTHLIIGAYDATGYLVWHEP